MSYLLSLITFLPLIAAAIIFVFINGDDEVHRRNIRHVALGATLFNFALSLLIWIYFDFDDPGFQFVDSLPWIPQLGISFHVGIDGISILLVLLTTLLIVELALRSLAILPNGLGRPGPRPRRSRGSLHTRRPSRCR